MSQNNMTTAQAFQVLDAATTPANAGKLNRLDYANIQIALAVLAEFVDANTPKPEEPAEEPKKRGRPPSGAFGAPVKS